MKLLNYTTSIFSAILLLLLSLWAVIFYFEMLDEIYDSLDDGLENNKIQIIQRAGADASLLQETDFADGFSIQQVQEPRVLEFTDSYRDTLMYMQNEKDYEPVRLLESYFEQDGNFYRVKVITSMVEEDDLVKELFFSLLWLYIGLILSIIVLNNVLHRRVWKPFYKLLSRLGNFNIEKDTQIKTEPTGIDEFRLLNSRVEKLLRKWTDTYKSQKQFIENTSHELQTPLAISINKLELLVEKDGLNEQQVAEVAGVISNLERLTRFNRSLLLLSKIENQQYPEMEPVEFNQLVKQVAAELEDLAAHRNMRLEIHDPVLLQHRMNRDLATILLSNLLKNALLHGEKGGLVSVEFQQKEIRISNPGTQPLDQESLTSRFQTSGKSSGSTGLGLAISKAIADRFGIRLSYSYTGKHVFSLNFGRK